MPPAATAIRFPETCTSRLMDLRVVDYDAVVGRARVHFDGKSEFRNPAGFLQGGILAAMLDDTMGPAVWAMTNGTVLPITIDMTVSFLAAARPGPISGEARVVQLGKTIAFVEAQLTDAEDKLIARATASIRLVKSNSSLPQHA